MAVPENICLSYTSLVIFGVIFLLVIQRGECIKCWECNSKYDPNCGAQFKNQTIALVDCNQRFLDHHPDVPGTICRKLTQKVEGETRIIRGCGFLETQTDAECINRAGTHQVFMQYCQCTGRDGCNSANQRFTIYYTFYAFVAAFVAASHM